MGTGISDFISLARHPFKFRLFLLTKLPSAFFSGVRVREMNENECMVTVPFTWFSKNPFRSTYFACLAMAAEMSTGLLALAHMHKRQPAVSSLVVKLEAEYFKKATGLTIFTCTDGPSIRDTIKKAITSGEGQQFRASSVGKNNNGELIARFFITWSFKAKP